MGKFKNNRRRKPIRAPPTNKPYPKYPVGSNGWVREQSIRIEKRRLEEIERKKFREKS